MIQILALLLASLCAVGYLLLSARGRRRPAGIFPLIALGLVVATASLLSLNVTGAQRPPGELRIYFSLADFNVIGRISDCLSNPTSDCPPALQRGADRVVAVVSQSAVSAVQASAPADVFDVVRGLETPDAPGGLTMEDGLSEISAETLGGVTGEGTYLFVTPRVRSIAAAKTTYQQLLRDEPALERQIFLIGEDALGIDRNTIVPSIELEAPASVSTDSKDYDVLLTVTNRTNASINLEGLQLVNTPNGASVHRLKFDRSRLTLVSAVEEVEGLIVPTDRYAEVTGHFDTIINSVTSLNVVARNQYGETLAQTAAITRVEKPVLGFLRMGADTSNDFRRFANSSGIEAADVVLDFDSLDNAEGREVRVQAMASTLAEWGMLIVAEPLTAVQGEILLEVLSRTPAGATPPSLLFAGGGDSRTLYKDFTHEKMAGWQRFLGPIGIENISGTRKIYVAVDQSGSLGGHEEDVVAAIETFFNAEVGLGGRDANLLVAFCGAPEHQEHDCKMKELIAQINQGLEGSTWEGADQLVILDGYAENEAKKFFDPPGDLRDVTDLVLFWDGDDVSGRFGGSPDIMPRQALSSLQKLGKQGVEVHVATFDSAIADPNVRHLEELRQFSGKERSSKDFRDTIVKNVIARGLTVTAGDTDGLPELAQRRVLQVATNKVQVINSLFPPNSLPGLVKQGTRVPLKVLHPSGYEAPLFAIRDALRFDVAGRQVTLKIGYLGLDLSSEFAAIKIDGEQQRRQSVSDVVYATVDAMGAKLRDPTVSWKFIDDKRLTAQRGDFMPFQVKDGLEADIRKLTKDGAPGTEAIQHAIWDEASLERMSIDLKSTQLDPGELYVMELSFCHTEITSTPDAECLRMDLKAPIVGPFPFLMNSSDWVPPEAAAGVRPDQGSGFAIPEPIAKVAFAIMAIAVATGVFLL